MNGSRVLYLKNDVSVSYYVCKSDLNIGVLHGMEPDRSSVATNPNVAFCKSKLCRPKNKSGTL